MAPKIIDRASVAANNLPSLKIVNPRVPIATEGAAAKRPAKLLGFNASANAANSDTTRPPMMNRNRICIGLIVRQNYAPPQMLRGHYNAAPGALKLALLGMLAPSHQPTHNERGLPAKASGMQTTHFVSIRNLQMYVFKLDTGIFNRRVSIRNLGLIDTIGLSLPTIR